MADPAHYIREPENFSILYSLYAGLCPFGQDITSIFFSFWRYLDPVLLGYWLFPLHNSLFYSFLVL